MSTPRKYRSTDLGDGAHIIYIPWEDGPMGQEPKPEGYDAFYAEFGLGPLVEGDGDNESESKWDDPIPDGVDPWNLRGRS